MQEPSFARQEALRKARRRTRLRAQNRCKTRGDLMVAVELALKVPAVLALVAATRRRHQEYSFHCHTTQRRQFH